MAMASFQDAELGDELLAAIGFIDEFPFAPLPSSLALPEPTVSAPGLQVTGATTVSPCIRQNADALSLIPLDELSSEEIDQLTIIVQSGPKVLPASQTQSDEHHDRLQERVSGLATQPMVKKRKTAWDPNKARNERREELVYLRKIVKDLESQLAELQARTSSSIAAPCRSHSHMPASSSSTSAHEKPKKRLWEQVAKNQWTMREKAERENIHLKLVLESQLKIARSLEKHLGRATSTNVSVLCIHHHAMQVSDTESSSVPY